LEDDEQELYYELSRKIAIAYSRREQAEQATRLEMLLRERANLLNTARNKLDALRKLVFQKTDLSHALFYCAPGQLDEVVSLLGEELGFIVHPFTAQESASERQRLLRAFASGQLQGLVAIRCLDEGVDVPATRVAYILASSSNPREFIQRRGRILRLAPNKQSAVIHDMLTAPEAEMNDSSAFHTDRNLVRREISRFKEFAETALNHFQAYEAIRSLARKYHLFDM
jgi:superfamily II DNA or RNA helicase